MSKKLLLEPTENVVCVLAEHRENKHYVPRYIVYIEDSCTGKVRWESLLEEEWSDPLHTLHATAAALQRELLSAVDSFHVEYKEI